MVLPSIMNVEISWRAVVGTLFGLVSTSCAGLVAMCKKTKSET
jgi:hypothetical protein